MGKLIGTRLPFDETSDFYAAISPDGDWVTIGLMGAAAHDASPFDPLLRLRLDTAAANLRAIAGVIDAYAAAPEQDEVRV